MSDTQRRKSPYPRFVAAAEAAVIASRGPLALLNPTLSDKEEMADATLLLFNALRELCHVHGSNPDTLWLQAKDLDEAWERPKPPETSR